MATRKQNEKRFDHWRELPGGGRRYWYDVPGQEHGFSRYAKIVDADETTLEFWQEIYDDDGKLIERHQKYPVDSGHQVVNVVDEG
jgi:hypothetical protein